MYLNESQAARFYRLYNLLIVFAHEVLGIEEEVYDSRKKELVPEVALEVAEELWDNRAIIDRFVEENPFEFDADDLEAVQKWRSALTGMFVVMEHTVAGSIFIVGGRAFSVKGITHGIGELVPDTPCVVQTTLLPFEGSIVFSMQMASWPLSYGAGMVDMFEDWYDEALESGPPITTADEFLAVAPEVEEGRGLAALDDLVEELERTSAVDKGDEEPPAGFHKKGSRNAAEGKTEGKAEAETEAEGEAYLDALDERNAELKLEYADLVAERANAGTPIRSIEGLFGLSTKAALQQTASRIGLKGYSKLKKAELASALAQDFTQSNGMVEDFLTNCDDFAYQTFQNAVAHGGAFSVPFAEAFENRPYLHDVPPLTYLFAHEEEFTLVVADEIVELARSLDMDEVAKRREDVRAIDRFVYAYTQLCGIVDARELYDLYCEQRPGSIEYGDFVMQVLMVLESSEPDYTVWAPEPMGEEEPSLCFINWTLSDAFVLEEDEDDEGFNLSAEAEDALGYLEDFRLDILERHAKIPRRTIPAEEVMDFDPFEYIMDLPEVQRFKEFLDNHIPDGEDDESFAEFVLFELYRMAQYPLDVSHKIDFLEEMGLHFEFETASRMVNHLMAMMNAVPLWINNGWTPTELLEKETGMRVFCNPDGTIMQVGRNDLCPCGSGKKYKKCCGSGNYGK